MTHMNIQEWWLVRHAPVRLESIYGQLDVAADYSEQGKFDWISSSASGDGLVLSSDLQRCVKTARKIIEKQKRPSLKIVEESAFREQHFGDWQGLTYEQAEQVDKSAYDEFWSDPVNLAPPGGESFSDVVVRVKSARKVITERVSDNKILLVTHAGVIRAFLAAALEIPLSRVLSVAIDPLSSTKLTLYQTGKGESWRVDWVNRAGS